MADFKHIIAIPVPFFGHVYPLLNLCCKLASKGCCNRVSILVHEEVVHKIEALKQEMEANGEVKAGILSIHSLAWSLLPNAFSAAKQLGESIEALGIVAQDVALRVAADETNIPVSCVLSDHQLGWAQDIANKLKIPRISLWICTLPEFALTSHMPKLIAQGIYNPFSDDSENCNMIHIPGYSTPVYPSDVPQISQHPEARGIYWEFLLRQMSRAKEAKHVLINSFHGLDNEACEYLVNTMELPVKLVGPLIPQVSSSEDAEGCLPWLNLQPPGSVLYASFGTLVQMASHQVQEIFLGIEASKHNFLIVFRQDILLDLPGPELASFVDQYTQNANKGKVVKWAPQQKVLEHPAIGGFFTHFGANSFYEGIRSGVPMIGKPLLGDQIIMRRLAIDHWKVALEVEGNAEHRHGVAEAVVRLIEDGGELRANVAKLKEHIRIAMQNGLDQLIH